MGDIALAGKRTFQLHYRRLPDRHYLFDSELIHIDAGTMVFGQRLSPSKPFAFGGRDVLAEGYRGVWFLFEGRPFDVGRIYNLDGRFTGYYVDILEPVHWQGQDVASLKPLTDLFLDIWISPEGEYQVLDEDELEEALVAGNIPLDKAEEARKVQAELITAIEQGCFPPSEVRELEL